MLGTYRLRLKRNGANVRMKRIRDGCVIKLGFEVEKIIRKNDEIQNHINFCV